MGRLHTLAAGTALLALGVKAQFSYQGCASLDTSNAKTTIELYPQSPAACLAYCNSQGIGYTYAGLTAQFCSCWVSAPVVTKKYADSQHVDCSFNCDAPYNNQYCGGIDLTTLGFLYSYYAGVAPAVIPPPVVSNSSSSSTTAGDQPTSSSGEIVPAPSTSSGADVFPTSASSTDVGSVIPTESSSAQGPISPQSSGSSGASSASGMSPASSGPSGGPGSSSTSSDATGTSSPPGVIVPTSSGSSAASPSATGTGGAPVLTVVVLSPGQAFLISIAPFLRNAGDQALSYIPSPPWFLYNTNTTSFFGTVPLTYPPGPLIITVTAGQPTTGSNGLRRRQVPAAVYTFAIELIIVIPGVPAPPLPGGPTPTPSLPGLPGLPLGPGPVIPGATYTPGAALPSYTNTIYQTITSTITRCPVCAPEVTLYAVPVGTTCITAKVFTTPCPITVTTTKPNGKVVPTVITTNSFIPYNPAQSTVVVTTVVADTTKYTTTLLVAVTQTVQKLQPTGNAGAVQPPPPPPPPAAGPPAAGPPAPGPPAAGPPAAGPPAPPAQGAPAPNGAPFAGPVAPPPNGAYGTGAANNGSQPAAPTMPVTAGANMDRFVEMFVLLCGVAFGALLVL